MTDIVTFTVEDARRLTTEIGAALGVAWDLYVQAYETRTWSLLGYDTFTAYCDAEFPNRHLRLSRAERPEVVAELRAAGMSLRAISATTGASVNTIRDDLYQIDTPAPRSPLTDVIDQIEANDIVDAEIIDDPEPQAITGLDGKRYSATPPVARRRSALTDELHAFATQFRRAVERLERFGDDDRFGANKEQVAVLLNGHLMYAIEVCQDLLDRLSHNTKEKS